MIKRKVWQGICHSVVLHVYVATHFSRRNGLIYRRKTKDDKKLTIWKLVLFIDVDKLVNIRNWWNKEKFGHLQLSYTVCLYSYIFFTSKQIDRAKKSNGRQKFYNVNVRAIYGRRQVGAGHEHLKKLYFYLNMHEPMLSNN